MPVFLRLFFNDYFLILIDFGRRREIIGLGKNFMKNGFDLIRKFFGCVFLELGIYDIPCRVG